VAWEKGKKKEKWELKEGHKEQEENRQKKWEQWRGGYDRNGEERPFWNMFTFFLPVAPGIFVYRFQKIKGVWVAAKLPHHPDEVTGSAWLPQVPQIDDGGPDRMTPAARRCRFLLGMAGRRSYLSGVREAARRCRATHLLSAAASAAAAACLTDGDRHHVHVLPSVDAVLVLAVTTAQQVTKTCSSSTNSNWLTDWVKILHPTQHKMGNFGDA